MRAAVAADCLVAGSVFIRLSAQGSDDSTLSPAVAARQLAALLLLMNGGGLFLPEAAGT